jgi:hypothetical protein
MDKGGEKPVKKSEEEFDKEYSQKITALVKILDSEKPEKLIIDLISIIPRETKSESLKVELLHPGKVHELVPHAAGEAEGRGDKELDKDDEGERPAKVLRVLEQSHHCDGRQ